MGLQYRVRTPVEESDRGGIGVPVFVQDQTTGVLTVPFLQTKATTALAVDAVVDSREVTLVGGHGTTVGEILEIADAATQRFIQGLVLNVVGDVITLDKPINYPYEAATAIVVRSTDDILVDGSVTPQVFSILPLPQQNGDIVRIIWEIRSTNAMDFSTFGGAPGLVNGCVLRVNHGDGTYTNLFNFKTNGEIGEQCYDVSYQENTGNSVRGLLARLTWGGSSKHGVVIRLDGNLGEALELVVQDNLLTGNTRFHLTAQGHNVQD
jgi:hypothetical protein